MIHVVAILTAKPGRRAEVLQHFHAIVPAVRAEKGCIEYVPVVDSETTLSIQAPCGPDTFVVIEKWESLAALEAHGAAPHMVEYGKKTREMMAGRAIHILSPA